MNLRLKIYNVVYFLIVESDIVNLKKKFDV